MDTKRWWMFSWLTGSGRFKDDEFDDDLDKLRDFYREDGYLDVEISEDKVIFSSTRSPDRLVLTSRSTRAAQYHIGEITFTGNKLSTRILAAAPRGAPETGAGLRAFQTRQGHRAARETSTARTAISIPTPT